jgi:hypothetical protein
VFFGRFGLLGGPGQRIQPSANSKSSGATWRLSHPCNGKFPQSDKLTDQTSVEYLTALERGPQSKCRSADFPRFILLKEEISLLRVAQPCVKKAPPAEPTALSEFFDSCRLVERIVAEGEEDDVVVRVQTAVGRRRGLSRRQPVTRRDERGAREQIERHVFILQSDPGAAEIAFVDVLPEADREFLHALDVRGADPSAGVEADGVRGTRDQRPAGFGERGVAPSALNAAHRPGIGLGLVLAVVGIDVSARKRMDDRADQELYRAPGKPLYLFDF